MLTPCIFKRGLVWILFFILSLVVIPFFSEEGQAPPPAPAANAAAQK